MRQRVVSVLVTAFALLLLSSLSTGAGRSAAAGNGPITLPDMRIFVPTDLISIGVDPSSGDRQLRFTHITADVGKGPFEIDPTLDPKTGTATFVQAIYRSPSPGNWVRDHTVPLAVTAQWHPPSDYQFPLTRFTLNKVDSDGSPGAVVAVSPKSDYCITGDAMLSGIPNTPDHTYPPDSNCTDPNAPLGWSVGWGDQYDQTDAGQPIDLAGVRDGTYVLHAMVDPRHLFTESNTTNDVTDTALRISGDNVTVLSQRNPGTSVPSVAVVQPKGGSTVSGTVTLRASATSHAPATIRSVQFLLDGQPLGPALHRSPYRYRWTVGNATPGRHYLSARATDSGGNFATAAAVPVIVQRPPSLTVRSLRWRRGLLTLSVSGVPAGATLRAQLVFSHRPSRTVTVKRGALRVRTPRPRLIVLHLFRSRRRLGSALRLPLDAVPAIHFMNPTPGAVVSGIVPVAAQATDSVGITTVQFFIDGKRLGKPRAVLPYAVNWDTRKFGAGRHRLSTRAVNALGNATTAKLSVTVRNPAPPMTCFVLQTKVSAHGHGSATTAPFHTAMRGETLVALVGADGPSGPGNQTATVSGAGLRWKLAKRANGSSGDAEIWTATATSVLTSAQVTATLANQGFDESLTVIAMEGTNGVGAAVGGSAPTGAPNVKLKTLGATSLIFATGNDWDRATPRVLPTGWVSLAEWLDEATGDTYWTQYTNQPTGRAGTVVNVGDRAPTTDQWNLVAVELVNSDG